MRAGLEELREKAEAELLAARSKEELLSIRTKYLGRKGLLTAVLRGLSNVSEEERPAIGKLSNEIKEALAVKIDEAVQRIDGGPLLFGHVTESAKYGGEEPFSSQVLCADREKFFFASGG